jgi:hypothetical protein
MVFTPGEKTLVVPVMAELMERPLKDPDIIQSRLQLFRELPREDQVAVSLDIIKGDAIGIGPETAASTLTEYRHQHPEIEPQFLLAAGRGNKQAIFVEAFDLRPNRGRQIQIPASILQALDGEDQLARRGAVMVLAKAELVPNEHIMEALLPMHLTDDEWKDAVAVLVRRFPNAEFERWTHDAIFGDKQAKRATRRVLELAGGAIHESPAAAIPPTDNNQSAVAWLPPMPGPSSPASKSPKPTDPFPLLVVLTASIGACGFVLFGIYALFRPFHATRGA